MPTGRRFNLLNATESTISMIIIPRASFAVPLSKTAPSMLKTESGPAARMHSIRYFIEQQEFHTISLCYPVFPESLLPPIRVYDRKGTPERFYLNYVKCAVHWCEHSNLICGAVFQFQWTTRPGSRCVSCISMRIHESWISSSHPVIFYNQVLFYYIYHCAAEAVPRTNAEV